VVGGNDCGEALIVRYLARRLAFAVFLIFAVSSASLLLAALAPGDYVTESFGVRADAAVAARARLRYGLGEPILKQYGRWLSSAVRLDFGRSLAYDRPVADLVPERAANTALLAAAALILSTVIGVPFGILSGSRHGITAALVRATSIALISMPPLLTSLALVFLAARTGWLPIGGMRSATLIATGPVDVLKHMIVPVCALALPIAATFERLQSQAISETLRQPFVIATLGRGVSDRRVVWRDALKAALGPVASMYGLVAGSLLSGSFVVEMVTAWPGLGRLMLDALRARDASLVAGCAAAGAAVLALGTFASDAAVALLNPRVRE
jgi:peptide/nickel transport system permease protein